MSNSCSPALLLFTLAACSQQGDMGSELHYDPVLVKARAMQAHVCVELKRSPEAWRSDFRLGGPGSGESWQTISEQPLVDHGERVSAVHLTGTGQVYLVVQGGFPETMIVYGPLPQAPRCE